MERASVAADAHAAWAGGAALSCLPLFPIAIDISFMPDAAELVTLSAHTAWAHAHSLYSHVKTRTVATVTPYKECRKE